MSDAMATATRAPGIEVAHIFSKERAVDNGFVAKERAVDVEMVNGFIAEERASHVEAANGFTAMERAGDVQVANGFVAKDEGAGDVQVANGFFTAKERTGDVEVGNGFNTEEISSNVEDGNSFMTHEGGVGDDEVAHDFSPLLVVYKSGRLERPLILPLVPPGHDDATGVASKDVPLSAFSFVRLYLPPEAAAGEKAAKLPVVVYFHGGGFVIGSAATCVYHRFLNDLAAACPAVAVSVDYRLAPEHLLPAAYEDSLAALEWVLSAADPWLADHGDLGRVFLAGDSAGGNICHHLAMHPDIKTAGLKGMVLIHPWFWGKEPIAGEREHRGPARADEKKKKKKSLWEVVCPDAADGVDDPRMNPASPGAPGLERLSCESVMVCVAEGDHLRWRGKAYADAAARAMANGAGPSAVVETYESVGVGHVFYLLDPDMDEARELRGRIARFVNASNKLPSERAAATASGTVE